jgi:outer membrane protein assembly factor BamB
MRAVYLLLFAQLLSTDSLAQNWPQFRGPGGSGVGQGSTPSKWNGPAGEGILWKTEIPGLGHSSPVIWGDQIFLTTAVPTQAKTSALKLGLYGDIEPVASEGAHIFRLYCLDRKSGRVVWKADAITREPAIKRHPKSTHANPTPATDGKRVIALFGSEGLFAYDLKGKLLWKKDLGVLDAGFFQVPSAQWGFASSPILHEGKVIVQADVQQNSFLAAFDGASGKELWRTSRADVPTFGTPAVAPHGRAGKQVVVNGWKHIAGYDLNTGNELWRLKGGGDIPVPTPVTAGDLILITNAHGGMRPIYAVRADASGDITGTDSIVWKQDRSGNYMQTPLVDNGLGYFCFDNGVLTVFDVKSGERIYQQRLGSGNSGFTSSPVAADGKLYVTNEEGKTMVLALGREYRLLAENELGETVMATPAISSGVLYVRGRNHLFAIGSR